MILTLMLAAAQPAAAYDPAAGKSPIRDLVASESGQYCLPGRELCLELSGDPDSGEIPANLIVSFPASGDAEKTSLPLPAFSGEVQGLSLWPHLVSVRTDKSGRHEGLEFLVGVIGEERAMYSGGGGSGGRLHLMRFGMGPHGMGLGDPVLDVVWDSSLMIRACFSEQDMKDRLEACHDDYSFKANLTASPDDKGAFPSLTYSSIATAYPRTSRRSEDNSAGKLKKSDLTHWRDPECSYTRLLHYNDATARYEMDRAAPDCSDYTTP
ncbi:MAG: hypothetical protein Q7T68_20225 [Sphingopyxis sp.]|nr:hypothetical protein [Sphingopyxis sp.]